MSNKMNNKDVDEKILEPGYYWYKPSKIDDWEIVEVLENNSFFRLCDEQVPTYNGNDTEQFIPLIATKPEESDISNRKVERTMQDDEVDLAYRVLQWMIFSGRFDNIKASNIRRMLMPIFGEKIIEAVKERYLTA